jgi:hypothetical protein
VKFLSPRVVFLIILGLFVFPLILAWLMYNGSLDFELGETSNQGVLLAPPIALDWSGAQASSQNKTHSLDGSWVILYPLERPCSTDCRNLLTGLRQMHIASGRDRNRIVIALLVEADYPESYSAEIDEIYHQFTILSGQSAVFSSSLAQASNQIEQDGSSSDNIFLVDPLGNIMMSYNGKDSPSRLRHDLKRLLKWSKLDKRS